MGATGRACRVTGSPPRSSLSREPRAASARDVSYLARAGLDGHRARSRCGSACGAGGGAEPGTLVPCVADVTHEAELEIAIENAIAGTDIWTSRSTMPA